MNTDRTRPNVGKISRYPPIATILAWTTEEFEPDPIDVCEWFSPTELNITYGFSMPH